MNMFQFTVMTFMTINTMYCKFQYYMPAISQRFTTYLTDSEWDDSNAFRAAAGILMFCALQDDFYAFLRVFYLLLLKFVLIWQNCTNKLVNIKSLLIIMNC